MNGVLIKLLPCFSNSPRPLSLFPSLFSPFLGLASSRVGDGFRVKKNCGRADGLEGYMERLNDLMGASPIINHTSNKCFLGDANLRA